MSKQKMIRNALLHCQNCTEMDYIVRSVTYICFSVLSSSPHVKHQVIPHSTTTTAASMSINSVSETAPMSPFRQQEPNYFFWSGRFFRSSDACVNFRSAEVESKRTPPEYTRYTQSFILFTYLLSHLFFDRVLNCLNTSMR